MSHDCIGWPNKKYQNLLYWKLCKRSKEIETLKKNWLTREQLLFPPKKNYMFSKIWTEQLTLSGENPGAKDGCMEQKNSVQLRWVLLKDSVEHKKNPTMSRAILYLWLYIYQVIKSDLLIP